MRSWWERVKAAAPTFFGPEKVAEDESKAYYRNAVKRDTPLPEILAGYAKPAIEEEPTNDFGEAVSKTQRGHTFFTTTVKLQDTVQRMQVTRMASIVHARMSAFTFQSVRPTGILGHVTTYDNFLSPGLVHVKFADDSRAWIQISGAGL